MSRRRPRAFADVFFGAFFAGASLDGIGASAETYGTPGSPTMSIVGATDGGTYGRATTASAAGSGTGGGGGVAGVAGAA